MAMKVFGEYRCFTGFISTKISSFYCVVKLMAIVTKPDTIGKEAVMLKLRNNLAGTGQVGKLEATIPYLV